MEVCGWLVHQLLSLKPIVLCIYEEQTPHASKSNRFFLFCLSVTGSLLVTKGTPPRRETSRADGILRLIANEAFLPSGTNTTRQILLQVLQEKTTIKRNAVTFSSNNDCFEYQVRSFPVGLKN